MTEIDEKLDDDIEKSISVKCIKGHKFKVPKEKIQTSSTGKSFVTLCPKCNGVARLKKDDVYEMFGVNPRDHIAVGNLYANLAVGKSPSLGQTSTFPPTVSGDLPGTPVEPIPKKKKEEDEDLEDEDELEEDEEDEEDDDDEEDEEDDDEEYTAVVETAPDVTGKKKTVSRFRVLPDEDESDSDSEETDPRDRTPIKSPKKTGQPVKKARRKVNREEYEDEDESMEEEDESRDDPRRRSHRGSQRRAAPVIDEDDIFDPNEVLKDLIEESGLDNNTLGRIFDYIDMQPDGWQPAAIQGVLQMYLSPASATKISQRYQAEIYKEEKRRDRERQMLNLVGNPSGSMRLFDNVSANFPPINNPVRQGYGQPGVPQGGFNRGFDTQGYAPVGLPPNVEFPPRDPRAGYVPYERPPAPRGMSPFEVERIIDAKLNTMVDKISKAMGETKREDVLVQESKDMRMMMLELLKERMNPANQTPPVQQNPQVSQLMQSQNSLVEKLLTHTLEKKKDDDPMNSPLMKILIQEVLSKKATSAPPLANTSEELAQRIQLQRLANELELAQADFKDKQEGRAFTRDIAGQALSKIGESVASAYIETQRIQAEAAKEIAARQSAVPMSAMVNPPLATAQDGGSSGGSAQREPSLSQDARTPGHPEMHKVRGTPAADGNVKMPCPTCGADMIAKVGASQVECGVCRTVYKAVIPQTTHVNGGSASGASEPLRKEDPEKKPDDKSSKYGFPVYDVSPEEQHGGDVEGTPETNDEPGESVTRVDWGGIPSNAIAEEEPDML